MIFVYEGKKYAGTTAIGIMREIEQDIKLCPDQRFSVRQFVGKSLARLADQIHLRELDAGAHLSDEALAFSYLCLLDEYGRLCCKNRFSGYNQFPRSSSALQ